MAFSCARARNSAMSGRIAKRIGFGAIMIAILGSLLYLDWWLEAQLWTDHVPSPSDHYHWNAMDRYVSYCLPTAVIMLALVIAGFRELARLADAAGVKLLGVSGLIGTCVVATYPYWSQFAPRFATEITSDLICPPFLVLLSAVLPLLFLEQMIRHRTEDALRRVGVTLLAILYLGVCGALILGIRAHGVEALVLFLVAVKCTDIGAYFTGTMIGRHKMIPWLSPGKTWEGLIGGLIVAAGFSLLVVWAFDIPGMSHLEAIGFGLLVGLAGQFGDLSESLLKRSAGTKDSGAVVPEFGGVLDIIDSPLLAAPVALVLLAILT